MQFYLAPMEGLTGYVYRNAYHKYFPAADRYFTPFITNKKMSSRERNDILPEHNEGMTVIPQILTNQAEDFFVVRLPHLDQNAAWHNGYRRVGGSAYGLRQISARGTDHSSADSERFL